MSFKKIKEDWRYIYIYGTVEKKQYLKDKGHILIQSHTSTITQLM